MKIIAISQRMDEVKEYGEMRDALDEKWSELFASLDAALAPVPNFPQALPAILGRSTYSRMGSFCLVGIRL